jgi:hypothetical protein
MIFSIANLIIVGPMRPGAVTLIALCAAAGVLAAQPVEGPPTLDVVLQRASAYVTDYQKRLQGVVAEETYRQNVVTPARGGRGRVNREGRELRSDLLLVKLGNADFWLQFRDVFEVDRKPVRDRDQRLYKLFVDAKADARAQAETIQAESSRYNIGPLMRTINIPIMALLFLEKDVQKTITFELGEPGNVKRFAALADPASIWMLAFKETQPGTMVKGDGGRDIPSHGRVWLDSRTGRILRTEQISQDVTIRAVIDVTYKADAALGDLLLPGEMRESYMIVKTETRIDGRATYGRYRQFTVSTSEKPKS